MAAEWPTLAVVFLLACLLLPTGGGGVRPRDDDGHHPSSWCQREECRCGKDDANRDTVKCSFSGEKEVICEADNDLPKSLAVLVLNGDGRCSLTVNNKALAQFAGLRSFNVTGFDRVTIRSQKLTNNEANTDFTVTISRVRQLHLEKNALRPNDGKVDVLVEDCEEVQMGSEVVSNLRSFVFRRIRDLHLSTNTFKNAAKSSSVIEKMILEDLHADKLPSYAFCTSIETLSITNCKFDTIERKAFPINQITNATLTNVTIDLMESEAFQNSTLISNLQMIRCTVKEMQSYAIMSGVQSIVIEQSVFDSVQTSAVAMATKLKLYGNVFERVAGRGFVLQYNFNTLLVDGNAFGEIGAEAFYEAAESGPGTRSAEQTALRVTDNTFPQSAAQGDRSPAVRLQRAASETNVTGNTFVGSGRCGPWTLVSVASGGGGDNGTAADDGDSEFADQNYCQVNATEAECANLTGAEPAGRFQIAYFAAVAGCDRDGREAFDLCVLDRQVVGVRAGGDPPSFFSPTAERGVITTVVLLVLCGFGAVCAVSAVTWLNARGYFIKLRSLLTPNGGRGGGDGSGGGSAGTACRTVSAHSLSRMSVHEYAELQRIKLGGGGGGGHGVGSVQMIVYQDKGTQTVPEELTHEMLQDLRHKLDDPDDYAEARGMIEHLYDLIRVEETCCGGGDGGWYSTGGGAGALDDMTSTVTTKAVTAGDGRPRDVKSVGTGAPSLDRLRAPRTNARAAEGHRDRQPQPPPPPPTPSPAPSVDSDYVDPVDLLYGGAAVNVRDDESYADIYCELTDLRPTAEDRQAPPPVPDKPTFV